MIIAFEVVLLVCAVFTLISTYGLHDDKKRTLSASVSVALFVLLAVCIGVLG